MELAQPLRSMVTENLGLKVLSLLFALVLYSMVHSAHQAERTFALNVITLTPPETSKSILLTSMPPQITVKVRGPASTLDDLHADDIGSVQADLRAGNEASWSLKAEDVKLPPGLEVEEVRPAVVPLQWDERDMRDVPVEVGVVGSPAVGFVVRGAPASEPVVARARGARTAVRLVQHVRAEAFNVEGLREGRHSQQLAIEHAPNGVTFEPQTVTATVDIGREVVEHLFQRVPVAVIGVARAQAKAQPAEVDVRLTCPPEIVRPLRAEQIVPRVQVASTAEHGSDALPVQLAIDQCEVRVTPPMIIVRW